MLHLSNKLTLACLAEFWWKLGLSVVLVLLGGVFAGLTLGLMGLDLVNLQGACAVHSREGQPLRDEGES